MIFLRLPGPGLGRFRAHPPPDPCLAGVALTPARQARPQAGFAAVRTSKDHSSHLLA